MSGFKLLTATASINDGEPMPCSIECDTEMVDVSSLSATRPDMAWTVVDEAGHFHAYDHEGKLPTLKAIDVQQPCTGGCGDSGCEGYTIRQYYCLVCAQQVEPRRVPDSGAKSIPGQTRWTVRVTGGPLPLGRVSVVVRVGGELSYFGLGEVRSSSGTVSETLGDRMVSVLDCGPFARRGKPPTQTPSLESVVAKVRNIATTFHPGWGIREALLAAIEPEPAN